MARRRPVISEVSYGLYSRFEAGGKGLPGVVRFTTAVPAVVGQEFGLIVKIKQGRGLLIDWEIEHPRVPSAEGGVMAPFMGSEYVRTQDYDFFLGDALWEPLIHMVGEWKLTVNLDRKTAAQRTFEVLAPEGTILPTAGTGEIEPNFPARGIHPSDYDQLPMQ